MTELTVGTTTAGLAAGVVVLLGLYFLGLGAMSWFRPALAARFLLGFAGSAPAHYVELSIRIAVGCALVVHAPRMLFPEVFSAFGWLLIGTTAVLLVVPWKWHRSFAQFAVPKALPHLKLIGVVSFLLGVSVLVAVSRI